MLGDVAAVLAELSVAPVFVAPDVPPSALSCFGPVDDEPRGVAAGAADPVVWPGVVVALPGAAVADEAGAGPTAVVVSSGCSSVLVEAPCLGLGFVAAVAAAVCVDSLADFAAGAGELASSVGEGLLVLDVLAARVELTVSAAALASIHR